MKLSLAAGLVLALLAAPALADSTAAFAAVDKQDYATAFPLMQQAAAAGDAKAIQELALMYWNGLGTDSNPEQALVWLRKGVAAGNAESMNTLANLYMTGSGVPYDLKQARELAQQSAALGNDYGMVMFYVTVINGPELDYLDDGKLNEARYEALAKRGVDQRALDIKTYDMLGQALDKNNPTARLYAISELLEKVGPGNRASAISLMQQVKSLPEPLASMQPVSEGIASVGDSYVNVGMFMQVRSLAQQAAATAGTKAGSLAPGVCTPEDLKVRHVAISRPLTGAVYLPLTTTLFKHFFLISGSWQEEWTFDACGKAIAIPVDFQADGMGNARFQVKGMPWTKPLRPAA